MICHNIILPIDLQLTVCDLYIVRLCKRNVQY
jgi:hypothetical protein